MVSNSKNKKQPVQAKKRRGNQIKNVPENAKTVVSETHVPKGTMVTLDGFFEKYNKVLLPISIILTGIFGTLLFDVKISTGGDDSGYIEMANMFLKGRSFPSWHGYMYSIFLSLPILVFGVNVVILKIISSFFIIGHLILFYYTFRNKLSHTIFTLVMLIIAVNSTILYFASQTYSEAMFMFLQSLAIFIFISTYLKYQSAEKISLKGEALRWLIIGFFVMLTSLTREIGIAALLAMVLFLLLDKKFRAAVMLVLSYTLFYAIFKVYRSVVWGVSEGTDKISEILQKNPYNRAMGYEDFGGMVDRFMANANQYLSKHFMIGLGLHDPVSTEKSWFVTIFLIVLFLISLYFAFRKNKIMLFLAIYLSGAMTATFIVLNQSWDQMRMVIIFIPMSLLLLAWGILQLSEVKGYKILAVIVPCLLVLIFFNTLGQTFDKVKVNQKILSRNIKGNLYYGFTKDWQNFLQMSEWVGKNIPNDKMVASRKPSMSYIYSKGRDFYGIYRFPTQPPDDFIVKLRKRTGELRVLPNTSINNKWPINLQLAIKQANVACVAEGNDIFGVYDFEGQQGNAILYHLNEYKVHPFSTDSLLTRIRLSKQSCFAVSPDSLLNALRRNNVEYVIAASLRTNPNMNTGNIINTVQRYLFFIEQKYPGILKLVHQIGSDVEEPAWLYKLEYSLYGL